jgi:hypothetical protein
MVRHPPHEAEAAKMTDIAVPFELRIVSGLFEMTDPDPQSALTRLGRSSRSIIHYEWLLLPDFRVKINLSFGDWSQIIHDFDWHSTLRSGAGVGNHQIMSVRPAAPLRLLDRPYQSLR